jgi:hypothetical protein
VIERKFYGCDLIVSVKNLEIARKSEPLRFAAQEPRGESMKRSDPRIVKRLSLAHEQIAHAFFHLSGGLIGKSHGENGTAGNILFDQIRDPVGNGARLSSARACKNQHRAFCSGGGFALAGIQFV